MKFTRTDSVGWVFHSDPDEDADDDLYTAIGLWEAGEFLRSEQHIKALISNNSNHIDAWHHLSLVYASSGKNIEAYLASREAVRIGLEAMPKAYKWSKETLLWANLSNRPFIRAYHNLGLWLLIKNQIIDAITIFERLTKTCQNDNIGARYLLLNLYIQELGDFEKAKLLLEKYPEDYSPDFFYGKAIISYHQNKHEDARIFLKKASVEFPLIFEKILFNINQSIKSDSSTGFTRGSQQEAEYYWCNYSRIWSDKRMKSLARGL